MSSWWLAVGLVLLLITGCSSPYAFILQENGTYVVEGRISGDRHAVNVITTNVVRSSEHATIGLRTVGCTDGTFSAELTLEPGARVTLLTRTTFHRATALADSGIRIEISNDRTVVTTPDGAVFVGEEGAGSKPKELRIVNDGRWCDVVMGCTHVGRVRTTLPSTEWIVATAAPGSFTVRDPIFSPRID